MTDCLTKGALYEEMTLSVRQVYDTFPYIRRANYNEPQQTAKGNIRECNERIGERP